MLGLGNGALFKWCTVLLLAAAQWLRESERGFGSSGSGWRYTSKPAKTNELSNNEYQDTDRESERAECGKD